MYDQLYSALDPTLLPEILVDIEQRWTDARAAQDFQYVPNANTFVAIINNTTARFPELEQRFRTPELTLTWMEACTGEANLKTGVWMKGVPCDFSGWIVGTNKQKVKVETMVDTAFAVPLEVYDNMYTPAQAFALAMMRAEKIILEKWNQHAIAKLLSYAGYNKYHMGLGADGSPGPTSWKITDVPYKNLNAQTFNSYVRMLGRMNKFVNPDLITGGALEVSEYVPGSLERFQFGNLNVYSDVETFPELGLELDMFLLARGAVAFVNIFNHPINGASAAPMGPDQEIYFSMALPSAYQVNGQPIMLDVTRKRIKKAIAQERFPDYITDNRCEWYEEYNIELKGEIMLNPLSCSDTGTGVLRLHADVDAPPVLSPTTIQQYYDISNA